MILLWILMLLGNVVNISLTIYKGIKSDETDFKVIGHWFRNVKNTAYVFIGLLASIVLLSSVNFDLESDYSFMGITFHYAHIIALFIGVSGQWLLGKLMIKLKK